MTCPPANVRTRRAAAPRLPRRARPPSIVTATLARNGSQHLAHDPLVEVALDSGSRIIALNGSRVWCARYPGLGGLFRKDRGPSKALGRALCDEVKESFQCLGFFTTDELPRYGIGRAQQRVILEATGAAQTDCVVIYAYPERRARAINAYLYDRLREMTSDRVG